MVIWAAGVLSAQSNIRRIKIVHGINSISVEIVIYTFFFIISTSFSLKSKTNGGNCQGRSGNDGCHRDPGQPLDGCGKNPLGSFSVFYHKHIKGIAHGVGKSEAGIENQNCRNNGCQAKTYSKYRCPDQYSDHPEQSSHRNGG